jgi:hypothetical protein
MQLMPILHVSHFMCEAKTGQADTILGINRWRNTIIKQQQEPSEKDSMQKTLATTGITVYLSVAISYDHHHQQISFQSWVANANPTTASTLLVRWVIVYKWVW